MVPEGVRVLKVPCNWLQFQKHKIGFADRADRRKGVRFHETLHFQLYCTVYDFKKLVLITFIVAWKEFCTIPAP